MHITFNISPQKDVNGRERKNSSILTVISSFYEYAAISISVNVVQGGDYMVLVGRDETLPRFAGILAVL